MPLPLLPQVFRVAITHGTAALPAAFTNVIHVSSATLSPSQVLTALDGAIAAGSFDCLNSGFDLHSAVITKLDNATPSVEGPLSNPNWNGTGSGEGSPASSAVVTLKTTSRGRRHTGRIYIGWVAEDKMASGQVLAASQAVMNAAWATNVANLTSAGIPLHVTSYGFDGVAPPPKPVREAFAASTLPVVTATVGGTLGTQRRRQSRLRS